jgi:hypothetical protein
MKRIWLMTVLGLTGCGEGKPNFEFVAMKGVDNWAMVLPADSKPTDIEAAARAKCVGESQCSIYAWFDRQNMATSFPMLDREVGALSFAYVVNRDTNTEMALFDCRHFKMSKDHCL